jgi:hypothetical protein
VRVSPDSVVTMPVEVVRAAARAAHELGALVLAHPVQNEGARTAGGRPGV